MSKLDTGYLYRRRNVEVNKKQYVVYELLDYVIGISYTNTQGNCLFNVVTGKYKEEYASQLGHDNNESKYVFVSESIENILNETGNRVDFPLIRKEILAKRYNYFRKDTNNELVALLNEDIILKVYEQIEQEKIDNKELKNIEEIYSKVKEVIIGQDLPVKEILSSLYKNQVLANSLLSNDEIVKLKDSVLVNGFYNTGKTETVKQIASICDIPMVILKKENLKNSENFDETISNLLYQLYLTVEKDIDKAQKGIVIIDLESFSDTKSSKILPICHLLEGSRYYFDNVVFDTSKLSIVFENNKSYDIIEFNKKLKNPNLKIVGMNSLNLNDIKSILLNSSLSPINIYKKLFEKMDIEFDYDNEVIDYIANKICSRGIMYDMYSVFERKIGKKMFELFTGDYSKVSLKLPLNEGEIGVFLESRNDKNQKVKSKKLGCK